MLICSYARSMAQSDSTMYVQITTSSKERLVGKLISKDDQYVVIETMDGIRKELRAYEVKDVLAIGKEDIHKGVYWFPDVNKYRYVAGTSAVPLKKGNGYVQSFFGIYNYIALGFTNHFSAGIGTVIDDLDFKYHSREYFMNLRYSGQITTNLYFGGECIAVAENVRLSQLSRSTHTLTGALRGMMSYMNSRLHITGSIGYGMVRHHTYYVNYTTGQEIRNITNLSFKYPMYTLSARLRLTKRLGLVMENNLLPMQTYEYTYVKGIPYFKSADYRIWNALGMNVSGKHWSLGIGGFSSFAKVGTEDILAPYIDIYYKFGK